MAKSTPSRRDLLSGLALAFSGLATAARGEAVSDVLDLDRQFLTRLGVEVTLNGQGRQLFLIDTGAQATSIAAPVAQTLGLPSLDPVVVHGTTGAEVMPTVALEHLSLKGQAFQDLRCPVLDRTEIEADGLLGLDVLGRFALTIDMERRQAGLAHSAPRTDAQGAVQASGNLIVIPARVNGRRATAFVDSGSQQSIGNRALLSALGASSGAVRPVTINGVAGRGISAEAGAAALVQVGGGRLRDAPLLFADLHCFEALGIDQQPALLIGADILTRFRWVRLDFADNSLRLDGPRRASVHQVSRLSR